MSTIFTGTARIFAINFEDGVILYPRMNTHWFARMSPMSSGANVDASADPELTHECNCVPHGVAMFRGVNLSDISLEVQVYEPRHQFRHLSAPVTR